MSASKQHCRPAVTAFHLFSSCVGTALMASSVHAAIPPEKSYGKTLEEVTVTARKREETLQEVPVAVSTLDAHAIDKIGFTNLADIATKIPSLSMTPFPNTSSAMVVFMRGVGTVDSEQIARDPGVGIYLDDIYLGRAQGLTTDLVDIERIEILRGPQGTLYGRNTIGGAIKFITAKPTGELGLKEKLSVGSRDLVRSMTTLNLPKFADVSASLSYLDSGEDGDVKNPGSGPDFGQKRKRGYRAALRWEPISEFTLDYTYDYSLQHGTGMYEQRGAPGLFPFFTTPISSTRRSTAFRAVDLPIHDDFTNSGHALTATWDVMEAMTLKSITSYRKLDADSVHDTVEAFGIPAAFHTDTHQNQFSQEFLLNGNLETIKLNYVAGVFYFREHADQLTDSIANPFALLVNPFDPVNIFRPPTLGDLTPGPLAKVENSSSAIYGQATWTPPILSERLDISLGARESRDERKLKRTFMGAPYDDNHKSFNSFDPSVTLDYHWTDHLHTYLSYAEAYRTGGFNVRSPANNAPYDAEKLSTYELGLKTSLASRLRANVALYRSTYKDIQLDFIDPFSTLVSTVNAGKATIQGVEMELDAVPIDGLQVGFNYAYMDARQSGDVIDPFTHQPLANISLPLTPHNKYNVSAEYTVPSFAFGTLSGRVDYSWDDKQTTNGGSGTNKDPRPSYDLLNARLELSQIPLDRFGKLAVGLWGKNLENKNYVVYRIYGADIYGEPRSYGIDLTYQF